MIGLGINIPILQISFGLLFLFILPGYALFVALFPLQDYGPGERSLFILGLSLVITILGGVILNLTVWGLSTSSWTVLLSIISLSGSVIGWLRRLQQRPVLATRVNEDRM